MKELRKNIWFTSDPHFGHAKCIEYCSRPYKSADEMDEKLIANWNRVVQPQDTVIVVGDFFMYHKKAKLKEILTRLHGKKILVRGNHDMSQSEMHTVGFDLVCDSMTMQMAGETVNISHYPYKKKTIFYRFWDFMHWIDPKKYFKPRRFKNQLDDDGRFLIHGHTHSKRIKSGKRMIHVGVDAHGFRPISFQRVADIISAIKHGRYKEEVIEKDNPHD